MPLHLAEVVEAGEESTLPVAPTMEAFMIDPLKEEEVGISSSLGSSEEHSLSRSLAKISQHRFSRLVVVECWTMSVSSAVTATKS